MKNYYDPMLFASTPEHPGIAGVMAVLKEEIDVAILREVVESLRDRFPYFYVRPAVEDSELIAIPNPLPIIVRNTWEPTRLMSKEANYHMTAFKYEGDPFTNRWSRAPGQGVDCSGLVMQACYGAGVDLWPSNPYRHRWGPARYEWESREIARNDKLRTVPFRDRKRGDLIFFCNSWGTVIHVAIYLGDNRLIHSTIQRGVSVTGMGGWGTICKVKRIFN